MDSCPKWIVNLRLQIYSVQMVHSTAGVFWFLGLVLPSLLLFSCNKVLAREKSTAQFIPKWKKTRWNSCHNPCLQPTSTKNRRYLSWRDTNVSCWKNQHVCRNVCMYSAAYRAVCWADWISSYPLHSLISPVRHPSPPSSHHWHYTAYWSLLCIRLGWMCALHVAQSKCRNESTFPAVCSLQDVSM